MRETRPPIFKRSWAMLRSRPLAYVVVTLLPYIAAIGLPILIGRFVVHLKAAAHENWDPISLWRSMSWGERLLIILAFIASATVPAYLAARGVGRMALAQQKTTSPSLSSVLTDMLRFIPIAILYFPILGIPVFVASGFLVFPGLLVMAAFALIIPAGIDGSLGPFAAIRRGVSLVGRVYSRVLAVYGCYIIFVIALRIMLAILIGNEDVPISSPAALWALLGPLLLIVLLPMVLVNIAITLLYCDATLDLRSISHGPEEHPAHRSTTAE